MDDRAARRWQRVLLVPAPPLSLLHLLAIRFGWIAPGWAPVVTLALLPGLSLVAGMVQGRAAPAMLLVVAAVELAWCALYGAMVGMAIGLRSL